MTDANNNQDLNQNPPDVAQNTDSQIQNNSIPYERFKQINDAKKTLEDKIKVFEDQERKRLEDESLKRGEFEKVINDLKPKAERTSELETTLKSYLESELADIPEQFKGLLPQGDVTTQLNWIKQAKSKGLFNRQPAPNLDAGAAGDTKVTQKLSDEQRNMARKFGMTDDEYAKHLWNGQRSF